MRESKYTTLGSILNPVEKGLGERLFELEQRLKIVESIPIISQEINATTKLHEEKEFRAEFKKFLLSHNRTLRKQVEDKIMNTFIDEELELLGLEKIPEAEPLVEKTGNTKIKWDLRTQELTEKAELERNAISVMDEWDDEKFESVSDDV